MNKFFNFSILGFITLLTMNSCSVVKCRYSKGWNLGFGKGQVINTSQVLQSKSLNRTANKSLQDSVLKSTFVKVFISDANNVQLASKKFNNGSNFQCQKVHEQNIKGIRDSSKYTRKSKKESKVRRRYRSRYNHYMLDNETEFVLFLFLLVLILAVVLIWALYALIRLIVIALRSNNKQLADAATASPKRTDILKRKDPDIKLRDIEPQTSFELDADYLDR